VLAGGSATDLRSAALWAAFLAFTAMAAAQHDDARKRSDTMHVPDVARESALGDRVVGAPESFLKKFGGELDAKLSSHVVTPAERKIVADALALLTPVQREVLQKRLSAIFFVDGLPNNALTHPAGEGAPRGTYSIAVRAGVLRETASELVTRKEQRLFDTAGSDMSVAIDVGHLEALTYVLLHEATHIVDGSLGVIRDTAAPSDYSPLVRGVWRDGTTPADPYRQPILMGVRYRQNGHILPISKAPELYDALGRTPFISVYGSCNWHEDIAELLAWTEVTERLHQPYRILIQKGGKVIRVIEPAKSKLVRARRKELGQLTG
jgi:hypothetical protein